MQPARRSSCYGECHDREIGLRQIHT
jgi:hypothetical protein